MVLFEHGFGFCSAFFVFLQALLTLLYTSQSTFLFPPTSLLLLITFNYKLSGRHKQLASACAVCLQIIFQLVDNPVGMLDLTL